MCCTLQSIAASGGGSLVHFLNIPFLCCQAVSTRAPLCLYSLLTDLPQAAPGVKDEDGTLSYSEDLVREEVQSVDISFKFKEPISVLTDVVCMSLDLEQPSSAISNVTGLCPIKTIWPAKTFTVHSLL